MKESGSRILTEVGPNVNEKTIRRKIDKCIEKEEAGGIIDKQSKIFSFL